MTTYRITVFPNQANTTDNALIKTAHQLNVHALTGCLNARVFFVAGDLQENDLHRAAQTLLADPITETYHIGTWQAQDAPFIEVAFLVGVTDPVAESLLRALHQLGIAATATASGQHYALTGALSDSDLTRLAEGVFANTVIHSYALNRFIDPPFIATEAGDGFVETIALRTADDAALLAISKERRLSLDLAEMQAIRAYYTALGRDATDVELETLAQTWSEHCVHKTFRATIDFSDHTGTQETIYGLLKTYIRAATEQLNKPFVRSAFVDNAGIIAFDETFDLAFKAETHNHPSALEPFGGANTGVGGVVRDVLGVSARPIANTDILCFGMPDLPEDQLLDGVLHPRRVADGVIHGVEDYGNKMGIPTVNGAIFYDNGYTANPLVFCGCVGILPHGTHPTQARDGDYIVLIGGRTGRDGLRGATFSSMEMDTNTSTIASVSVQIGHPINEKQVQEVILRARDERLYTAITDCGAGGLSSAVGEMGKELGAEVELTSVPLKYSGLRPWEIWLSEAQERMVLAVSEAHWERLCEIARGQDVEITRIGTFRKTGKLTLQYDGHAISELDMHFLHEGIPTRHLKAHWAGDPTPQPSATPVLTPQEALLALLAHPNIRSKEAVVRRYDHEVQGGTVVKPFNGVGAKGHSDGAVIVPLDTQHRADSKGRVKGFALSNGICPQYTHRDPYQMAWLAVDEAMRNLIAIGADPEQVSILDNFCWGNPNLPDRLGTLVLTSKGCYDAALAYGTPFVSGKDSLNNEYADANGTRHAIPGTLLISAIGIVPDVQKTITSDLKSAGNTLYVVGAMREALGESHYYRVQGITGGDVPQVGNAPLETLRRLHKAMQAGAISACHDISEGGLAVALAEMCIGGNLGADITTPSDATAFLFAESPTCFVLEVAAEREATFKTLLGNLPVTRIGTVTQETRLHIRTEDKTLLTLDLSTLESAWRGTVTTPSAPVANSPKTPARKIDAPTLAMRTAAPRALILHANGTNRDRDAALACELAGATAEIVHMNQLIAGERVLAAYDLLVIAGGFSYGDDLGAGQLWAQDLRHYFQADLEAFAGAGKPVLGICNGFQVLMKSGLLPYADFALGDARQATLTYNEAGHFECRWVHLSPNPHSANLFTYGLEEGILCPVAHGEGRVILRDESTHNTLWQNGQITLQYSDENGQFAGYPINPNGSTDNIAALCNRAGNVMGLMPHPENHVFAWQHPRYHRGERGKSGLVLFENAVKFA